MKSGAHSVYDLKYHLVLITKYRRKCFTESMLTVLEALVESHCKKWGVELIEFGGESDHIHLLIDMPPTIEPAKFIGNLKSVSSRIMRKYFQSHLSLYFWKPLLWSSSYCLLSVGGAPIEKLKDYIQNQERPA